MELSYIFYYILITFLIAKFSPDFNECVEKNKMEFYDNFTVSKLEYNNLDNDNNIMIDYYVKKEIVNVNVQKLSSIRIFLLNNIE